MAEADVSAERKVSRVAYVGQRVPVRPKVALAIISELRSDIASGKMPLGSRLPTEQALARQFGVSQPTMREAIRALDAMGLVDVRHGSGVYVSPDIQGYVSSTLGTLLQMADVGIFEALDVREHLGVFSAQLASQAASSDDLAQIERALVWSETAEAVGEMAEAVVSFQIACSAASHNPLLASIEAFLIRLLMQFQVVAEGSRGVGFWRERTSKFAVERRELFASLASGDQAATMAAMTGYLAEQREWFAADEQLADVRFSDPSLVRALDNIAFDLLSLRDPN